MSAAVAGLVKNGVVVPKTPLPKGALVEIHLVRNTIDVPQELQEEFDAWERAGAGTLEAVELLGQLANT